MDFCTGLFPSSLAKPCCEKLSSLYLIKKNNNTGKLRLRPSIFLSQCRKDGTELKIYCCC